MRFKSFTIRNYRAIGEATVEVGNRLIPLIGVNESGKTSVLQAILAFDRLSDKYYRGQHLEAQNKYDYNTQACTVDAEIVIESEEAIQTLASRLQGSTSVVRPFFQQRYDARKPFVMRRDLTARKYSILDLDVSAQVSERVAKNVYLQLPFILYFDDFTDRVPPSIEFKRDDTERGYTIKKSRLAQWQRILEEIFRRATNGSCELEKFITIKKEDQREALLNDINDVLNEEVMQAWRTLRQSASHLADEVPELKLALKYISREGSFSFQFKVEDTDTSKRRPFNVTDRSKGLQWFFNFATKLKFNPKYASDANGAIYLLDEPGSYLHSSAQAELLAMLKGIAEQNTTIYCTHSEHLLDPSVINVSQIRVVEKEVGVISVHAFGSSKIKRAEGALAPLYHALRMRTGVFNRRMDRCILLEGISDYCLFDGLKRAGVFNWSNVDFVPGAGAHQLRDLISLCISYADSFLIVLDTDVAGRKAAASYKLAFGPAVESRIRHYENGSGKARVTLEDLLSDSDRAKLSSATGCPDLKDAILAMYYQMPDNGAVFLRALDEDSLQRLAPIANRISALADPLQFAGR